MTMQELIDAVKAHAKNNYNQDGWDFVVECYEDTEIADAIKGARNGPEAIKMIHKIVLISDERRREVQSEIF